MNNTYYNEKLETLPENLQYAVIMSKWKESLVQIQTQFKLHIDQTQVLEESTIKLMFGDIDAPDFINHMFTDAHINSETAADILLEVDLKILKKIREKLESLETSEKDEEEIENFLLDAEERKAREEDDLHAKHYEEIEKIREEDDMSPEDEEEAEEVPEVKETPPPVIEVKKVEVEPVKSEEEIHVEMLKEKDELLNEINSPTKSFILESSKIQTIPVDHQIENTHLEKPFHPYESTNESPKTQTIQQKTEIIPQQPIQQEKIEKVSVKEQVYNPIPADHQLQNTHIEKPFHQEPAVYSLTKPTTQPVSNTYKISTALDKKPEIKKPIIINLDDLYREPLK